MCYSAKIQANYREYVRRYGADMDIETFRRIFFARASGADIKIPKAVDAAFAGVDDEITTAIAAYRNQRTRELETALFEQRARLAAAEKKLAAKITKKASEDVRIATNKIDAATRGLDDLRRQDLQERDSRIFPGWYAPVLIELDGKRLIVPMRYRCRIPGWTEAEEKQKQGSYNARFDSLGTAWRKVFGFTHGIVLADTFFEHVDRDGKDVILRFDPTPPQQMQLACLWTCTEIPGADDLWSFAAITDDPPPEVAAAGHDRCVIPLKSSNVDAWLAPDPSRRAQLRDILADRERPYYEHQLAA
ncbi:MULTISPECIES: SOS response-associated peptidase family protein [Burkholderia]|jgi:putative SOS response-associated peptidase YedK|uniref:Abasic site processing protein n=7 Tax=root TaxID=1 RepID=A0A2S5DMY6_9BURK|nr:MULTISPECIES: SOS response-associated peptidase family protein [Burkholderia]EKS9799771.1 SOS response-associated peptidase family protein [Burkholderia cepacia]EKS9806820.1 SOS response-associated peptidase family protein [Burkholderia cepacia]EKS9814289.1 SOS response-associated peptidase family protein [Burkholderia cepacia]EKS9821433.1 SOS response-associated peptidase family protein [Burkholderia cepacia]EKS9829026.1 SOS response-associated peptidase family protein [Burkholderia cepaci